MTSTLLTVIRESVRIHGENKHPYKVSIEFVIREKVAIYITNRFMECLEAEVINENCIIKLWESIVTEGDA